MARPSIAALKVLARKIAEEINNNNYRKSIPFEKLPLDLQKLVSQMNIIDLKTRNLEEERKEVYNKLNKCYKKHSIFQDYYMDQFGRRDYDKKAYYKKDVFIANAPSHKVYEELLLLTNFTDKDLDSIKKEIVAKFTK